ncbi:MAG: P-II family nitrogen regulator [Actinobacteria bacterium]|nr:P-II family nitrogen regulator [Actinomycetota bacterium]
MKEIIAIIRRTKVHETKTALDGIGYPSMSISSVYGRGKQMGIMSEIDPEMSKLVPEFEGSDPIARFIPKRMLTMVVDDASVEPLVNAIIRVNQTGNYGDGKIFVLPIGTVVRVRTGEAGENALR